MIHLNRNANKFNPSFCQWFFHGTFINPHSFFSPNILYWFMNFLLHVNIKRKVLWSLLHGDPVEWGIRSTSHFSYQPVGLLERLPPAVSPVLSPDLIVRHFQSPFFIRDEFRAHICALKWPTNFFLEMGPLDQHRETWHHGKARPLTYTDLRPRWKLKTIG